MLTPATITQNYSVLVVIAVVATVVALIVLFVVAADIHMQVIKIQAPQKSPFYSKFVTV